MVGADVAELRALADAFATSAELVERISAQLTPRIMSSGWHGPDVERFRHDWNHAHRATLSSAARSLQGVAGIVRRNADEQEQASAAGTGSGAAAGTAGTAAVVACYANPTPAQAHEWWDSLTPAQQEYQIAHNPSYVGSLDGLPATVRDRANRIVLEQEKVRLADKGSQLLKDLSSPWLMPWDRNAKMEQLQQTVESLQALQAVEEVCGPPDHPHADRQLLMLNVDQYPPKAAIGVGDVDTADHVAVFTPGMTSKVSTMQGNVDSMVALQKRSENLMAQQGEPGSVATIMWLGYDAPQNLVQAAHASYGQDGAPALESFAEGIKASRPDGVHLTALGHSYGSYTTGLAVQKTDAFDDAVFFGSPGLGTQDAADLQVGPGHSYLIEADARGNVFNWDPVADSGHLDPFGLNPLGGDPSGIPGIVHLSDDRTSYGSQSDGHSQYLLDQSTSQYNIAAVVTGNPDLVVLEGHSAPGAGGGASGGW
jgi:hypothetical protein